MDWLLSRSEEAVHIARNNVKRFRDWYLTPDAEACSCRKLVEECDCHSFEPGSYKRLTGRRYGVVAFPRILCCYLPSTTFWESLNGSATAGEYIAWGDGCNVMLQLRPRELYKCHDDETIRSWVSMKALYQYLYLTIHHIQSSCGSVHKQKNPQSRVAHPKHHYSLLLCPLSTKQARA